MPERIITQTLESQSKQTKLNIVFSLNQENISHSTQDSEEIICVLKNNAFKFFLYHSRKADNWKEDKEQNLIDKLVHQWKKKWIGSALRMPTLWSERTTKCGSEQMHLELCLEWISSRVNSISMHFPYSWFYCQEVPEVVTLESGNSDLTDKQLASKRPFLPFLHSLQLTHLRLMQTSLILDPHR